MSVSFKSIIKGKENRNRLKWKSERKEKKRQVYTKPIEKERLKMRNPYSSVCFPVIQIRMHSLFPLCFINLSVCPRVWRNNLWNECSAHESLRVRVYVRVCVRVCVSVFVCHNQWKDQWAATPVYLNWHAHLSLLPFVFNASSSFSAYNFIHFNSVDDRVKISHLISS